MLNAIYDRNNKLEAGKQDRQAIKGRRIYAHNSSPIPGSYQEKVPWKWMPETLNSQMEFSELYVRELNGVA
jgi:hypothetical protein